MVPVATLPAAAIMMGIGYWIDPMGWGSGSPLAAFLIKAGAAIIDNMSILLQWVWHMVCPRTKTVQLLWQAWWATMS